MDRRPVSIEHQTGQSQLPIRRSAGLQRADIDEAYRHNGDRHRNERQADKEEAEICHGILLIPRIIKDLQNMIDAIGRRSSQPVGDVPFSFERHHRNNTVIGGRFPITVAYDAATRLC
jgi:hypothetical protein